MQYDQCPCKKRGDTETDTRTGQMVCRFTGRAPCDDGGRDGSGDLDSQGAARGAGSCPMLGGRHEADCWSGPPRRDRPADTPFMDFWPEL